MKQYGYSSSSQGDPAPRRLPSRLVDIATCDGDSLSANAGGKPVVIRARSRPVACRTSSI